MSNTFSVDHSFPISFSKTFEKKYGTFKVKNSNLTSERINSFTLNDVKLIQIPQDIMNGDELYEWIGGSTYVPLDTYHAMAIYRRRFIKFTERANSFLKRKIFDLKTVSFLGTMMTDGKRNHISCFDYNSKIKNDSGKDFVFMCYEAVDPWFENCDLLAVFKENFIEKISKSGNK